MKLILTMDDSELAQYELGKVRLTIGRLTDNDIHIDNLAVSAHHAVILTEDGETLIEDMNSTNGTYVNGRLVSSHPLKEGDVITIGRHQLHYTSGNKVAPRETNTATASNSNRDAPAAEAQGPGLPKASLRVLDGEHKGKTMEISKALTTLGRSGIQVAAITRRADGFFIVHVDSGGEPRYPKVNDIVIGANAHRLKHKDVIELADTRMEFCELDGKN